MKYKFLAFAALFLASLSAYADLKVGFVQVDKILQEAPQTIESNKKLEKEFSSRTDKLKADVKSLKERESSFSKDALTMKESERDSKEKSLSQLRVDVQRKERELREDINIRRNEELGGLQEQINKAVTSVAKAEGFDLVLYNGVAYASEKIDITDKILKSLGKK
ncbi:OmpH family outer membrane protein [Candidatus Methylopumilus universalis]|uniref:OmpH family outer membrane protein n=1 Tax=Candidatus Methylopumilus universalis TaxID=2588536 RepID=UPI0011221719|nr:OmpH family outer membrane protein [Candidatus Methylopumilus universalis]QDC80251.1 OmpH family outer membrane protein [Candidatus Methylopumilus universalis]QDC81553.1 OmpH family outer membrane protein [Candidatus Methylopumilus universalis]QDC87990.1 OmpH family outer membrane protein [Candidatus Methylopumilus universalis]